MEKTADFNPVLPGASVNPVSSSPAIARDPRARPIEQSADCLQMTMSSSRYLRAPPGRLVKVGLVGAGGSGPARCRGRSAALRRSHRRCACGPSTRNPNFKFLFKLLSLPWREQRLHVSVALWMLGVKLALYLLPFRQVRRWVHSGRLSIPEQSTSEEVLRIVRAVERIGRALGRLGTHCLPQALVACRLLRGSGYDVCLKIGVRKDPHGRLAAHAWVEYEGRVILGDLRSPDRFSSFPGLGGARS